MDDLILLIGIIIAFLFGWLGRMLYEVMIDIQTGVIRPTTTPESARQRRNNGSDLVVYNINRPHLTVAGRGTVFCPRCGKETDDTGQFCQWCGADLDESQ